MSGGRACRILRSAADPATSVLAVAESYRTRLRHFFKTPEQTVDLESLADFLCTPEGVEKRADPRPASERLREGLAGVQFRRPAGMQVSLDAEDKLLGTLIAQSDHQNLVTARFLGLLQKPGWFQND